LGLQKSTHFIRVFAAARRYWLVLRNRKFSITLGCVLFINVYDDHRRFCKNKNKRQHHSDVSGHSIYRAKFSNSLQFIGLRPIKKLWFYN